MGWMDWLGLGKGDSSEDPRLQQAIERAVDKVEPRLKQAGGYPGRYRSVLGQALCYADQLAAAIPGPVEMDREHFMRDPFVHTLFGSHHPIQHTLCLSRAMQEYLRRADAGTGDIHALMGMRRMEKRTFGMETEGDVLRRDVAQQTVSFSDHTLSCITHSEAETRAQVAWSIFDSLIAHVASHVEGLRQEKLTLEKRRDELMARLRGTTEERRNALEQELEALRVEMGNAIQRLNLDRMPAYFEEQLRSPETLVRLEQQQRRLDGMGIVRAQKDASTSNLIVFTDLVGQDRRRWTVTLVHCGHPELPPLSERLENANRWLAI